MRANSRDLYLNVSGNVTGLSAAMKAGRSLVLDFGTSSIDVLGEVERKFADLGKGGTGGLKDVERAYTATFDRIRKNADAVLKAPTPQAAVQIVDAQQTLAAAEAAERKAQAYRLVAEAANRADQAQNGQNQAVRAYAVAAAQAAVLAEQESAALREQAGVLGLVDGQIERSTTAQRRSVQLSGQAKAGYQQLSYQLGDVATQYASGTSATLIFAQQSGQVIQAISLITGEAKGLLGLLGGPWGIAFSSALVLLTPWVGKILEGGDALERETDKLKDNADKSALAERAKQAFLRTEQGAISDVHALTEELKKQNEELKTNAERLNIRAKLRLQTLAERRSDITGSIASTQSELAILRRPENATAKGTAAGIAARQTELVSLKATLADVDRAIAEAEAARTETQKDLAAETAKRATDGLAAIKYKYEGAGGLIDLAKKHATAEEAANGVLTRRLTLLAKQQKAEEDAEQKRQSAAKKTVTLGSQVTAAQGASLFDSAASYRGLSEKRDNGTLKSLFTEANMGNVDPKITAWCAAFVNAVLATNGLSGTGALNARSFLNYGTSTNTPQKGDIVVSRRGTGAQGHVGFFEGTDAKGNVLVLGGNTADKVGTQRVARNDVLGFRRVSAASDATQAAAAQRKVERAADKRERDAAAYADLLNRSQQEQLDLRKSQATSITQSAELEAAGVELERRRLSAAAQLGADQGRWTQAQADALKQVYAQNAVTKQAAITTSADQRVLDQLLDQHQTELRDTIAGLQVAAQLATTQKERRRVALAILAAEEEQARSAAIRKTQSDDPLVRADGERDLAAVDRDHPGNLKRTLEDTGSPIEQLKKKLHDDTDDMNAALEQVGVHAFDNLEDGILRVLDGTGSITDAFHSMTNGIIADLARIAIEKAILKGLDSVLPGAGTFLGFKEGGQIRGFAGGGRLISGAGTGTSDSILALVGGREPIAVSNGESINTAAATRDYWPIIDAMNKGRLPRFATGGVVGVPRLPSIAAAQQALAGGAAGAGGVIQLRVALSEDLHATIDNRAAGVAVQVVRATAPEIVDTARQATMASLTRPGI